LGKKVSQQELAAMGADEDPCAKAYEYLVLKRKFGNLHQELFRCLYLLYWLARLSLQLQELFFS